MKKIIEVIKKDLKLLIRSRTSSLVLILGPLLIILVASMAFNTNNKFYIRVGVFSESYSSLSKSYIELLKEKSFIVMYMDSENDCINGVKSGKIHACIIFSKDLRIDPEYKGTITFYVDYSKINLVWIIKDALFTQVENKSKEITKDLTQQLIDVMTFTSKEVKSSKENMEEISKFNDLSGNLLSSISSVASAVKTSFNWESFGTNELKKVTINAKTSTGSLSSLINTKLNEIKENLTSLKNNLDIIENESIRNNLENKIENIITQVNDYSALLKDKGEKAENDVQKIISQISKVELSIEDLKKLLNNIELSKKENIEKSTEGKKKLVDQLSYIVEVKRSLDEIKNKIDEIKIKSPEKISEPIKTLIKPVVTEQTLTFIFPVLLSLIISFIGIMISSILIQTEKNSSAHLRNLITPTRSFVLSFGNYLTTLIVVMVQVIFILIIVGIFFEPIVFSNFFELLFYSIIASSVYIIIGIFIGNLMNSEEGSAMVSLIVSLVFILLSGILYPIEGMPELVRKIAKFNPLVLTEHIFRQKILHNVSISLLSEELLLLVSYLIGLFILLIISQGIFNRKYIKWRSKFLIPKKKKVKKVIEFSEEVKHIQELISEIKKILHHKRRITKDEIEEATRIYLKIVDLYQKLNKKERSIVYEDIVLVHRKLETLKKEIT